MNAHQQPKKVILAALAANALNIAALNEDVAPENLASKIIDIEIYRTALRLPEIGLLETGTTPETLQERSATPYTPLLDHADSVDLRSYERELFASYAVTQRYEPEVTFQEFSCNVRFVLEIEGLALNGFNARRAASALYRSIGDVA